MGRNPCCDKSRVKRGSWSPEEDATLKSYLLEHGTGGNWISLPQKAGLRRCGKSCRLRWLNYLRPDIKHGAFTQEEDNIIYKLHSTIGSRWSVIASHLPGRTDNSVKNHWNSKLRKSLIAASTAPETTSSITNAETISSITTTLFNKTVMFQPGLPDFPRQTISVPFLNGDNISPVPSANFASLSCDQQLMNYSTANSSNFSAQQHSNLARLPSFSMMSENYYEVKCVPVDEENSFGDMTGICSLLKGHGDVDLCSIFQIDP